MKSKIYTYTFLFYTIITIVFFVAFLSWGNVASLIEYIKNDLFSYYNLLIFLTFMIVHELIHYTVFRFFGVSKENVSIGFSIKKFMPYVKCKTTVHRSIYATSALAPFLILGLFPLLLSVIESSIPLFVFSIIMAKGAAGDLAIVYMVYNQSSKKSLLKDSDTLGFEVVDNNG